MNKEEMLIIDVPYGNDKPIKMVFTDRFDIETLPNNVIKFSESIKSDIPFGYVIVADDEWDNVRRICKELGIEIYEDIVEKD